LSRVLVVAALVSISAGWGLSTQKVLEWLAHASLSSFLTSNLLVATMFGPFLLLLIALNIAVAWRKLNWLCGGKRRMNQFAARQRKRVDMLSRSGVQMPVALATIQREARRRFASVARKAGHITADRECEEMLEYLGQLTARLQDESLASNVAIPISVAAGRAVRQAIRFQKIVIKIQYRELSGRGGEPVIARYF
jgi:hypothetical protein